MAMHGSKHALDFSRRLEEGTACILFCCMVRGDWRNDLYDGFSVCIADIGCGCFVVSVWVLCGS